MSKEINLDSFADKIAEKLLAAKQQANEAGQDVGEEFISGVSKSLRTHSKEAKSEIAKLFEDFNKITNNFKSRKSISNAEWKNVLKLSEELLKSERYADAVRDKLDGIAVTLKGIGKVSGLTNVLKEIDKAGGKLESVHWDEVGKNYKKKVATKKTTVSKDVKPAIDTEKLKQKEVVKTDKVIKDATDSIKKQGDAIEAVTKKMLNMEAVTKRYNKLMMDLGVEHLTIGMRLSQDTEGWGLKEMVQEAKNQLEEFYNPEHDSYIKADGLTDDIKKRLQSDIGKLKRFISAYEPYVDSMESTAPAMNSAVKATEKHTDALREQARAAESAAEAQKKLVEAHDSPATSKDNIIDNNQKKIASYQDLLEVLREYFSLTEKTAKSKLDSSFVEEFERVMPDYGLEDLDAPEKKLSEIMERFKRVYKMLSGMKKAQKDGIDFIDADNMRISNERLDEEIDYATTKLAAMAHVYMELGGNIGDFNKAQQKIVTPKLVRYDKENAAIDAELNELNTINAPIETAKEKIANLLKSMLPALGDTEKLTQLVTGNGQYGKLTTILSRLNANANMFDMIEPERAAKELASIFGIEIPQAIDRAEAAQAEFTEETKNTADAQEKLKESAKGTSDVLYHAGDLSNPSGTLKSFPLGNVPPTRSNGIGGLTGLYTTDDLDGFIGNEWQGAPISTIDPSAYKLLSVGTSDIADKIGGFLNDVNATIYGYYNAIDENDWEMKQYTDVKSVEELYEAHKEIFKDSALTFEQFTQFINQSREKIAGKSFADIELPAIDEGIAKSGISSAMQDVAEEIFNSDSFQTQFLKMLGYEGVDLRGTKYNGTYTGGSVIFDVKPESIQATNEKWSDVMLRNGFEVTEDDLKHEEKRRQLAFDTAQAYSKQADAAKEASDAHKQLGASSDSNDLQDTFDIIQQGEKATGKFVTTASTLQEALQKMRQALPEEHKEWASYVDDVARREDDKIVGAFNSISGSMGRSSGSYKIESLDDGRIAITFSGIRSEIEKTADAAENTNKILIDGENKYQQELDDTTKIQQNRRAQAEVYTEAATNLLSAGYESVPEVDQANLMAEFGNKIYTEGISASEAMDQLYMALEKVRTKAASMPEDIIDDFGAENEQVAKTVANLQKLSSVDVTRIFDSVDLKSFLEAFNIDQSHFATFKTLFEELMQIANAMANGVDVGNAFNAKMAEITDTIMDLGGHMEDISDSGYADMIKQFYGHMSKTKVQFNKSIKSEYTKDQWKSLYDTYKGRLTSDPTKGIAIDSLYQELSGKFPHLFPQGVINEKDQFKLVMDKLDEANRLRANNWQTLHGFASSERGNIQLDVDDMYKKMEDSLFDGYSAGAIGSEADAAKDVEQSMSDAADAKAKFASANKQVGDSANASADQLDDEAAAMKEVAANADDLPDGDVVTKLFIGENDDPSGAIIKKVRLIGDKMQTEVQRLAANEDGEWDVAGSTVTEKKLIGMQDYVSAYKKEANKLRTIEADIRALGSGGMSAKLSANVEEYTSALKDMDVAMDALRNNPDDVVASQQFDDATRKAVQVRGAIEGIFKESQKLKKIGNVIAVDKEDSTGLENLKMAMIEFANSAFDGQAKIKGFNDEGTQMYATLDEGAGAVKNITVALDSASGRLQAFTTGTSKATNEWNDFKKQITDGAKRMASMYLGFNDLLRYGKQGVSYVKEIDLALTELKKVTNETDEAYKEFLNDAAKTSSIIGSTISDFTEATATFAKLGYTIEESSEMAEAAIIYKNVADGLDSVEDSADSIISTMKAFGIEAANVMSIVDKFNAVGNSFAITSAGIGEALQRSASALQSAGNTLDESVALVTAANSVIQNPEQVGELIAHQHSNMLLVNSYIG